MNILHHTLTGKGVMKQVPASQSEFYGLLKELNKELTIVMVSHDLLIVSNYAKSIVCLNKNAPIYLSASCGRWAWPRASSSLT